MNNTQNGKMNNIDGKMNNIDGNLDENVPYKLLCDLNVNLRCILTPNNVA